MLIDIVYKTFIDNRIHIMESDGKMIQSQNDNILLIFVLKINQLTVLLAIFTSTLLCL